MKYFTYENIFIFFLSYFVDYFLVIGTYIFNEKGTIKKVWYYNKLIFLEAFQIVYRFLSISYGIDLIWVPSSSSIWNRFCLSFSVMKLMARPRCPNLPDLPILWRYVSAYRGKSKLMTTLTERISIPLAKMSVQTRQRVSPFLKSW